jgi:hypothetical protein
LPGHVKNSAHDSDRKSLLRGLFRDELEPY